MARPREIVCCKSRIILSNYIEVNLKPFHVLWQLKLFPDLVWNAVALELLFEAGLGLTPLCHGSDCLLEFLELKVVFVVLAPKIDMLVHVSLVVAP